MKKNKGDEQMEQVGLLIVSFFKTCAAGAMKMIRSAPLLIVFLLITTLSAVIYINLRCRTCRTWIAGRIQHTKADTEIDMAVSAYNTVSVWQCFRREEHKLSRSI